jgi:hypothetical protein
MKTNYLIHTKVACVCKDVYAKQCEGQPEMAKVTETALFEIFCGVLDPCHGKYFLPFEKLFLVFDVGCQ